MTAKYFTDLFIFLKKTPGGMALPYFLYCFGILLLETCYIGYVMTTTTLASNGLILKSVSSTSLKALLCCKLPLSHIQPISSFTSNPIVLHSIKIHFFHTITCWSGLYQLVQERYGLDVWSVCWLYVCFLWTVNAKYIIFPNHVFTDTYSFGILTHLMFCNTSANQPIRIYIGCKLPLKQTIARFYKTFYKVFSQPHAFRHP